MRFVRPLRPAEIRFAVSSRRRRFARAVLRPEALHRRPRLQKRPVDGKMLRAQQPLHLRRAEQRTEKPLPDLMGEQAVAVLREGRGVEDLLVDRKPDEPAEQKLVFQPLHKLPLRADRIQKLQKRGSKQPLRWDRRTPEPFVKRRKRPVELSQRRVGHFPHRPQWMLGGYPGLDVDLGKQRSDRPILATHPILRPNPMRQRITAPRQTPEMFRKTFSAAC
jgi:hypothetical protein